MAGPGSLVRPLVSRLSRAATNSARMLPSGSKVEASVAKAAKSTLKFAKGTAKYSLIGGASYFGVRGALSAIGKAEEAGKPIMSFDTALAVGGEAWKEFDEGPIRELARMCFRSLPLVIRDDSELWSLMGHPDLSVYRVSASDALLVLSGAWIAGLAVGVGASVVFEQAGVLQHDPAELSPPASLANKVRKFQPFCYLSTEKIFEKYAIGKDGRLYLKDALKAGMFVLDKGVIKGPFSARPSSLGASMGEIMNEIYASKENVAAWAKEAIAAAASDPRWKPYIPKALTVEHMLTLLRQEAEPAGNGRYSCVHINGSGYCGLFQFKQPAWTDAQKVFPWLPKFKDGWQDGRANTYAAVAYAICLSKYAMLAWRTATTPNTRWSGALYPNLWKFEGTRFEPSSEFLRLAHNQFYYKPFKVVIGAMRPSSLISTMGGESEEARQLVATLFTQFGGIRG